MLYIYIYMCYRESDIASISIKLVLIVFNALGLGRGS